MDIRNRRTASALVVCFTLGLSCTAAYTQESAECSFCDDANALIEEFGLRESKDPVRERANWRTPKKIVTEYGEEAAEPFRAIASDAVVIGVNSDDEALEQIADADVYFTDRCPAEILARGENLRWVHTWFAGVDHCLASPVFAERDILLTNTRGVYAVPISQHAIALMLALANKLPVYHGEQAAGEWTGFLNPDQRGHIELRGKTVLVVGLGGIGTQIARQAHGLGLRVIATRRSSRAGPDFVDYVGLSNELYDLAGQADVVISVLPLTDETRGMLDSHFFEALPEGALFVNVGRGENVVQEALIAALESGRLGGAAMDVTNPDPLPKGHKLWSMPNVILTPHVANSSDLTIWRADVLSWENLRRFVEGERMLNVVDIDAGY